MASTLTPTFPGTYLPPSYYFLYFCSQPLSPPIYLTLSMTLPRPPFFLHTCLRLCLCLRLLLHLLFISPSASKYCFMTHSEYHRNTILIPQHWGWNQREPRQVLLSERNTGKPDCTNEDKLIPEAGYVLLQDENPSSCDKHLRMRT